MFVSPSMTPMHNKNPRHVRTMRRTQQGIIDQIARSTRIYRSHRQTDRDRCIVQTVGEHIGEGIESRLAFVRDYLSRGDDVGTRSDTGDVGTGRGCGRMVDVGSVGVGSTGMTQLKGLRTSKTLECLRLSHSGVCLLLFVLPCGKSQTEESRHLYWIPGRAVGCRSRCRLVLVIPMRLSRESDTYVESTTKEYSGYTGAACCWC